ATAHRAATAAATAHRATTARHRARAYTPVYAPAARPRPRTRHHPQSSDKPYRTAGPILP
ncbi:hypothetical protein, partial [Streptomyces sp. SID161]|uniref:hypothetical protein n=1 Tax=Streptomyces sp. SID161 TaxID=2690251 RepID=UPI001F2F7F4C